GEGPAPVAVGVEATNPPPADGVLEGLTRAAAGDHARALLARPVGRTFVEVYDQIGTLVSRRPLHDAACVDGVAELSLDLGQHLSPGQRRGSVLSRELARPLV